MTTTRMKVAIEEVLTASTGAEDFRWLESREDGGLTLRCEPTAPDWVPDDERESWVDDHALETWVHRQGRPVAELRQGLLQLMLCSAIREAADAHQVRGGALGVRAA